MAAHVVVDALVVHDVEVRQGHGRAHRMPAPGVPVREHLGAVGEGFEQSIVGDHRAHGGIAGGHALGAGDDVRDRLVAGDRERLTDAPKRADSLVGHQQDVVAVADLPHPREVPGWGREAPTGVLHRFQEHRRDRLRTLHEDRLLDLVGRPAAEPLDVVAVLGRPVEVGVGHLQRPGHQGFEGRLRRGNPGDAQGAVRGAVVGHGPTDHLRLQRLTGGPVELLGQFPRALHRLAAAGGEEHPVEVAGC